MRKRIILTAQQHPPIPDSDWLDLERLAEVEITSEDPAHPIESELGIIPDTTGGDARASLARWRLA